VPDFMSFGFFGALVSGIYDIITLVLNAPITMVGRSVSQVFYQKVSSDLNEGKPISGYIRKSSIRLFLFMLIPMTVIFFFGKPIFAFVFGEDYRIAGVEFRQNLIFLLSQIAALLLGYYYFEDFKLTFILLATSGFLCYSFFIIALIRTAKKADQ
jgi:O-antigen/teichoic acid export membrane protein